MEKTKTSQIKRVSDDELINKLKKTFDNHINFTRNIITQLNDLNKYNNILIQNKKYLINDLQINDFNTDLETILKKIIKLNTEIKKNTDPTDSINQITTIRNIIEELNASDNLYNYINVKTKSTPNYLTEQLNVNHITNPINNPRLKVTTLTRTIASIAPA